MALSKYSTLLYITSKEMSSFSLSDLDNFYLYRAL